jgi:hypothetical protein
MDKQIPPLPDLLRAKATAALQVSSATWYVPYGLWSACYQRLLRSYE